MPDHVVVQVAEGALRGCKETSKNGKVICRFQGIPYAAPPVGPLRFRAPQPAVPWRGIRDALNEGNICSQMNELINDYDGSEDCLFLNVFTPVMLDKEEALSSRKAVMVFIHGGGFTYGSGNAFVYHPEYLVEQDVVAVTFNYRLGPLGFLCTEDGEIPGNAGMKDQVALLRWVKKNIAQFGGDPKNVTIFGESAGGASVHYHLLSPMSRGLFHRAISQSGCALNNWAFSKVAQLRTFRLAQALGCKSQVPKEVTAFLKKVPVKQLVMKQNLALSPEEWYRSDLRLPFVPCSEERSISAEEKFLHTDPIKIIESCNFTMVPYITGINTNEGLLMMRDFLSKPELIKKYGQNFEMHLPEDLFPQVNTKTSKLAAEKLKKFYFGDKPFNETTMACYTNMKSDTMFAYKVYKSVQLHAHLSTAPLYYYQFAFDGTLGFFKHYFLNSDVPGVSHVDELGYLFNPTSLSLNCEPDSPERKVLNMMVTMWTNFAKTGNPSAEVTWEPVTATRECYLKIDKIPVMLLKMEKRRMDFWDEFYKTYTSTNGQQSKL